jgi:hypothetical protein
VIVIHAALVEAVHAQPGPELIETLPELAVEGNDSVSGETTDVQAPDWLPEPCVTVNFSPATWIAPVRAPAEFGWTSKPTAPLPFPLVLPVKMIQGAVLTAVHEHPAPVITLTWPLPPPAGSDWLLGTKLNPHDRCCSACSTSTRSPFTEMEPWRDVRPELAATRKLTEPLPCPLDADVIVIQFTSADALHAQSRSVVTATVPEPPPGSMCAPEAETETAHLLVDGPVTLVVELAHALETAAATAIVRTTIRHRGGAGGKPPEQPLRMLATWCLSG